MKEEHLQWRDNAWEEEDKRSTGRGGGVPGAVTIQVYVPRHGSGLRGLVRQSWRAERGRLSTHEAGRSEKVTCLFNGCCKGTVIRDDLWFENLQSSSFSTMAHQPRSCSGSRMMLQARRLFIRSL
nr:hypothetical protein CFP56_20365 [Quercus suber]